MIFRCKKKVFGDDFQVQKKIGGVALLRPPKGWEKKELRCLYGMFQIPH